MIHDGTQQVHNDFSQTTFDFEEETVEDTNGVVPDVENLRALSKEPISTCGHCGGRSKVYAYKLGSYARVLCWMAYKSTENKYHHIPSSGAINGGGDYAKLRYWGLIDRMSNTDGTKRSSGMWRLTDLGRDFARGHTTVSAVCYYRHPEGGVLGFEPEQISIREAIGKQFDYNKLMQGYTQQGVTTRRPQ